MEEQKNTFYITTPIFYPNANLHMGHAYTTTLADIIARYHRLRDVETYLLVGADENTEKVVRAAEAAGKGTQEYLDGIVRGFQDLFSKLEIDYDQFIRTSDNGVHWPGAMEIWRRMVRSGDIEKRTYSGLYCVGHESFITEKDLVDGKCPEHNEEPQKVSEENYFFKLSKYSKRIEEKIKSDELAIIPHARKNEILALIARGLEDISFSRPAEKMSVGIPVPDDPTQKIYVWGDALANYASALGFGRENDELFKKFWPADLHVIGKDILRFHAAIWPGMLMSAGLPLPKSILVHGFITSGGKKMSKSLGNVIDPNALIAEYGAEAVRYYLARHISPFEDGDMTQESFKGAYNADLANGLGNLVSRVLKMAVTNGVSIEEEKLNQNISSAPELAHMESYEVNKAGSAIWGRIQKMDQYIQVEQPFKKIKADLEGAKKDIRYLLAELYAVVALLRPIMPETSKTILDLVRKNKMPESPLFPRK
ncbi:MAG: methionine--tRNA ligase [Candidatus Taylorbacteria bacterium RIFCSPLOWO2_12_FULL_43_20]|uniref:Methionine--tRNA ligase n=1 Tax=Candidatus Taylorbacteria bacterium RIFCSPLOWO2_12_FULL_43_20 TaxID=1802332 RepID=A0A1G2P415_9BACT|nr:MAG: methionine--tRNA ligase [Candidatus Taylorbacteria bacterium RIFCSPHIGHO2_01_FULL_43_120]OHA22240.1 MAG: methionine--tRNA ligase [Candidatus Taylorbacteria bacterium RIFCSPHIGHO2_02_FULL_43_55]OHA28259.1 MAG: methionine--tRNA ligase [Candidatus Taylorbacteria bacterium RIFCSPHIGHO2_12_FULL_42_34]OHA30410.1 MAG: methionine--tRNA ligase [Candidatus Taylorbacteria bacterium RIFCSPLOWO2_01_FULL_43_83]OHA39664.1 MAG: methionine--tRNA ligase [Candidatus Taylorbacteria bacterium RIFCSPLOWO2_02